MFELLYVQYSKVAKCIKSSENINFTGPFDFKNKNKNQNFNMYSIEKYKCLKVTEYNRVY